MSRPNVARVCVVLASVLLLGSFAAEQAWAGYLSQVVGDNPLGYWRLGEASGATAANQVGSSARRNL